MLKSSNKLAKTAKYLDKAYDTSKALKRIKNSRKALETPAEVNKRKRQLAKVATENKVKELTKGLEKLTSSKGRKFTQEAAEQLSEKVLKVDSLPKQTHHFLTNKNSKYTHQFEEVVEKYDLKLDGAWNKELMPHRGRHPNDYHDYMLNSIREIDNMASGNQSVFLSGFSDLKKEIINNPGMIRKSFWKG